MKPAFMRFVFSFCLAAALSVASASEPAIIAKARAYIGPEEALNNLKSVHYVGSVDAADPANPTQKVTVTIDLIFQRPDRQRIVTSSPKVRQVNALDGYDAWELTVDPANPASRRLTLHGPDQIRRLRANTWENLSFFRGIGQAGGRLEDLGPAKIEGVACQKIAFIHSAKIVFVRYFDVATGRLVLTETETGGRIVEEGELRVEGIRFPRVLTTTSPDAKGNWQTVRVTFEKITVNETFPESHFAIPSLLGK